MTDFSKQTILINPRIKRFFEFTVLGETHNVLFVHLSDIDESFVFDDIDKVYDFIHAQERERTFHKETRLGYFDYVDENNERRRYYINKMFREKIVEFTDEVVVIDEDGVVL